ncbi:MAG TPA: flagellar biosynthesis protein FlhF [Tepidisphaeraceae bacterium]|nr:flagellar biosynthesis protein FlhF [Tepidisphaeraceae bacterium]
MQLRTFTAPTMAEALQQVKQALGSDAVILHTRTYQRRHWLGLRKREVVEITATNDMRVPSRRPSSARTPAPNARASFAAAQTRAAAMSARPTAAPAQSLLQTPAATNVALVGLSQEMSNLKTMVLDLVKETRAQRAPQVSEDLFEHYMHLIQNQVAEELAVQIVKGLQTKLRPDQYKNEEFVRGKIAEQVERMLPVAGPIVRTKTSGPHVVALIGPTGVGKTTTIAKLAANLKLRERRRVGLITIDTYRIAAVDQLKKYADILGSPLRVVNSPDDLRDAILAMSDCEFVLIDTAGRSPSDALKLSELKSFLNAARPDEVHLVLSTTASQECIESAIARFSEVRVDKIIFTKLDEAVHVGVVLNVVRKVNKSLSYITTGQDVPNDIEVGRPRKLAQLILGDLLTDAAANSEFQVANATGGGL